MNLPAARWYAAPLSWSPDQPNPFSSEGRMALGGVAFASPMTMTTGCAMAASPPARMSSASDAGASTSRGGWGTSCTMSVPTATA